MWREIKEENEFGLPYQICFSTALYDCINILSVSLKKKNSKMRINCGSDLGEVLTLENTDSMSV